MLMVSVGDLGEEASRVEIDDWDEEEEEGAAISFSFYRVYDRALVRWSKGRTMQWGLEGSKRFCLMRGMVSC